MTARRARFQRLANARHAQHAVSVAQLRSVQDVLRETQQLAEQQEQQCRQAFVQQDQALQRADHHDWLLARSAWQLGSLHAHHRNAECSVLQSQVHVAEGEERLARRELHQVERLIVHICDEERELTLRKEQTFLDEAARILGEHSSMRRIVLGKLS